LFDPTKFYRVWILALLIAAGAIVNASASKSTDAADSLAFRALSHSHHELAAGDVQSDHEGHILCAADPCGSVWVKAGAGAAGTTIASHVDSTVAFDGAAARAFVVRDSGNTALTHRRVTVLLI
jgi:hypothetical protein